MNQLLPAPGVSGALWRYRWSSLAVVVATVVVSLGVAVLLGRESAAEARIVLKSPDAAGVLGTEVSSESGFVRYVNQRALFVTSDRALGTAREKLGGNETITELREAVTAEAARNGESIVVTVDIGDARRSREIADAVVAAYRQESHADVTAAADETLKTLRERRETLVSGMRDTGGSDALSSAASQTIGELDRRSTEIQVAAEQFGDGVAFVDRAVSDDSGWLLGLLRNGVIGLAVGVLLASVVAWVRADRNRRVRDADDLSRLVEEPLLGEVEALPDGETPRLHNLMVPPLGSYQLLASALRNTARGGVVAVTGTATGDGATTTVLQVAGVAARDGLRVAVVDAAVRTRELSQRVAVDQDWYGLAPVATGATSLKASTRVIQVGRGIEFRVVPAGQYTDRALDYFRSSLLRQAMVDLRAIYDLVLVDLPPLESAPEVSSLVPAVDDVVVAVRRERAVAALRRGRERIGLLGGTVAGHVFTFARSAQSAPPSRPHQAPRVVSEEPTAPAGRGR